MPRLRGACAWVVQRGGERRGTVRGQLTEACKTRQTLDFNPRELEHRWGVLKEGYDLANFHSSFQWLL